MTITHTIRNPYADVGLGERQHRITLPGIPDIVVFGGRSDTDPTARTIRKASRLHFIRGAAEARRLDCAADLLARRIAEYNYRSELSL